MPDHKGSVSDSPVNTKIIQTKLDITSQQLQVGGVAQWSGVRRMNEDDPRRARLVLGWVTDSTLGGYTISVCNQPTRSTQTCIPPGLLNRVPASAG